ncbi:MAG: hypothetical protein V7670_03640 [Maribacter arcticus]|uniref:hypothetical protein n=1 Tax=Maribacter arcticus TaxID=561365 RepID=UPI003002A568
MKLRINILTYFIIYFYMLMALYHYKIKTYFYWDYIAFLKETSFDFSISRFLVATLLFFLNLYCLFQIKKTNLAFIIVSLFFALVTIPSLISYTSANLYSHKLMSYHQLFFYALFIFSKIKINFRFPVIDKKQSLHLLVLITTLGIVPYLIIYGPYINLKNLLLVDVYKTRSLMSSLSNPYFGYTYSIFTKIIIPLIIVFSIELKNKIYLFVGIFYLVLFYLFGAHKTVYAGLVLVLIFYKFSYEDSVKYIVRYSNVLIFLCFILALINIDYGWILTFRRIHFIPALLDICYLDFFEGKPLYWSDSILKGLIDYPYDLKHVNLIGKTYFNRAEMGANNGLVSEGYMNLGTWGVLINILLVSVYFSVLNSLKIPSKYFGLFFLVIFSFISSSVFTVFLTHGAIALLLVAVFLLNEKTDAKI